MIVKYLTAQQRLAFGDKKKKEARTGFYWQAEVDDAWIGPFESLEEEALHRRLAPRTGQLTTAVTGVNLR